MNSTKGVNDPIRWGILGTGDIATSFATGLGHLPDADLVAVGSRSEGSATAFATRFNIPRPHASYEALAADPEVDVIYVATPHVYHKDNALLCLDHGKPVLCEKPFTINRREAETVTARAREKQLFLMEAMWSRFFPAMTRLRELLAQEAIGELRLLQADFGFRTNVNPQGRLFNPALGGGALLDVGVYVVSLASMVLGTPTSIASLAQLGETGVDEQSAMILSHDPRQGNGHGNSPMAVLTTAIRTNTPQEAVITGTDGVIRVHKPWWQPERLTLEKNGREPEEITLPFEGNGLNHEAAHVMTCLREGRQESPVMPLEETLTIMTTLDAIRAQWGLTYPTEQ